MIPALLKPDLILRHVGDIRPSALTEIGIRAVVIDLDNTLVTHDGDTVAREVAEWMQSLRAAGFGVCIASNTRRMARLARLAGQMEILHVPRNAGKPGTTGLRHALELLNAAPTESAMVGDQLLTDILAGNRLGMTTILVNPLSPKEFLPTRIVSRTIERVVLRGKYRRAAP